MTQNSQDKLLAAYHKLEDPEQRILQALSVIYEPTLMTELRELVQQAGLKDAGGRSLSGRVSRALLEKLLRKGMLQVGRNRWSCHSVLVELLSWEAVDAGLFSQMAAVTTDQRLADSRRAIALERLPQSTKMKRLRLAFYQKQFDEVQRILGVESPFTGLDYDRSAPLIRICTAPFCSERFNELPPQIRFLIIGPLLNKGITDLEEQSVLYDLLERSVDKGIFPLEGSVPALLAEQRLIRGRIHGFESLLQDDQSADGLALMASLRFLEGENERALEGFDQAIKAVRKEKKKRNMTIGGLPGVFYVLALIVTEDKQQWERAEKHMQMARKIFGEDPWLLILLLLEQVIGEYRGHKSSFLSDTLRYSQGNAFHPYEYLFILLSHVWLGTEEVGALNSDQLARLKKHCDQAHSAGLNWYAVEGVLLLQNLGVAVKKPELEALAAAIEYKSLTQLLAPKPQWQRSLLALQELQASSPGSSSGVAQKSLRMVWWLETNGRNYSLHPREQRGQKNGRWSKGRSVALKRLCEDPGSFDYLTDQDLAICRTIERYSGWGYYGAVEYELPTGSSLSAAVGHPLIFWAAQPGSAVELLRGEPELLVQQRDDKLLLQLTPALKPVVGEEDADKGGLLLSRESENRVRIIDFSSQHMRIADILGPEGLEVPLQAKTQVLDSISAIAPLLTVHSDIGGGDNAAEMVDTDPRLHVHLQPAGLGLRLEWFVRPFFRVQAEPADASTGKQAYTGGPLFRPGEGGATVFAEIQGKRLQTTRDQAQERVATASLLDDGVIPASADDGECVIEEPELALEALLKLQAMGDDIELAWPKGQAIRLKPEAGIEQMQIQVRKQRDWFSLEGGVTLDDGSVLEMTKLLTLVQEAPGRFVHLGDGQMLALTRDLQKRLGAIAAFSDEGRFHALATQSLDESIEGMEVSSCEEWRDQLNSLDVVRALQPELPSTLQAELRDYQVEAYDWLVRLSHWGAGACLADDMGLGKTVQALALILSRAGDGPTLILAPTSVCMNWLEEAVRFAPTLNAIRFGDGDRQKMLDELAPFDLLVCSYGLLQNEAERMAGVKWHTIVADEAQAMKNAATKRSKAAMALQGDFKMITTGTPIENHLGELWNLFRFINPGLLGSLEQFNERFANPIEVGQDRQVRLHLRQLIRPFILRRLKSDVLTELPARTEVTLHVELGEEERILYEAMRLKAVDKLSAEEDNPGQQRLKVLVEITRLRRVCCNPRLVLPDTTIPSAKLKAFAGIVKELLEGKHKALVFSQFVGHLTLIRQHLDEQGVHYQYLDGSTSVKKRKAAVDAFQRGEGDVFLISLKAGGAGLNLTAADYVIHMDPWWNPAVEDQASDRAHRMGQQRPVTIYRLVAKDTIEDKIVGLHEQKRDLANSLLEGSEMSGKMSVDEMFTLIQGD